MTRIAVKARRMGRLMNVGAMITVAGTGVIGGNGGLGWEGEQMLDASGGPLDMSNLVAGVAGVKLSLMSKIKGSRSFPLITPTAQTLRNNNVQSGNKLTVAEKGGTAWEGNFVCVDDEYVTIMLTDRNGIEVTAADAEKSIRFKDIMTIIVEVDPQLAASPAQNAAAPAAAARPAK